MHGGTLHPRLLDSAHRHPACGCPIEAAQMQGATLHPRLLDHEETQEPAIAAPVYVETTREDAQTRRGVDMTTGHADTTHSARYREIAAVLRRHSLGFLGGLIGLDRLMPFRRKGAAASGAETHESPMHVRLALEELGPTFIKLGQVLSTRPDLLPPAYIEELAKLQDAAPPVPVDLIRDVIRRELGGEPEDLFASFENEPLASASIGQAHVATLRDGTPRWW
jgi:hypothetical protein